MFVFVTHSFPHRRTAPVDDAGMNKDLMSPPIFSFRLQGKQVKIIIMYVMPRQMDVNDEKSISCH